MDKPISRRELAIKGGVGIAGLALAASGIADVTQADIEKGLAQPLPAEANTIFETAMKTIRDRSIDRRKFKLTDSSEPCTMYVATEKGK